MCIAKVKGDLKSISTLQVFTLDEQISSAKASGEVVLPGKILFNKGYKIFCISAGGIINTSFSHEITEYGEYRYKNGFKLTIEKSRDRSLWGEESTGHFSLKNVTFPLKIRSMQPGDRFKPLGTGGFKKIKDLFIDEKVPRFLRKTVPVVECPDGIIWVGGFRIDDRFKVNKNERYFLRIRLNKPELKLIKDF
jgi:tRNA(Ile)-lysidine synthase